MKLTCEKVVATLFILGSFPVWRKADIDHPVCFWEILAWMLGGNIPEHIPLSEAIERMKQAYLELYG